MSCLGLLARACARFDTISLARGRARSGSLGLRGALAGLWLSAASSCDNTDVVASYLGASCQAGDDCEPRAGCSARVCAPLASGGALCAAETPSVHAGDSCDASGATQVVRYGLCSCTDLVAPAALRVDAFDATLAHPVARAAALGVNRHMVAEQGGRIDGSLHVAGMVSGADLEVTGERTESDRPPCACADSELLDVAALVRAARDDNDNAALALDPDEFASFDGDSERTLPCGRYFLTRLAGSGALTLRAQGNVALFIESNVELDQAFAVLPEPGARVDLFVAGEMRVVGAFTLGGDPSGSGRAALFSGGRGSLHLSATTLLVGTLYAPHAELVTGGDLEVYGSLFVERAALEGDLILHQDVSLAEPGACETP